MRMNVLIGNAMEKLRGIPSESFRCCVTSPPYWNLRDYRVEGQLGLEATPEQYVNNLVAVLDEVKRTMTHDGTIWLNIGDSYAGAAGGFQGKNGERASRTFTARIKNSKIVGDLKPKDMVGIPWMLAFALRAGTYQCDRCGLELRGDQWPVFGGEMVCIPCCRRNIDSRIALTRPGWYLRSDVIWHKPNPMPESTKDRPTKCYEHIFLLAKSHRYFYNGDAIRDPRVQEEDANGFRGGAYTHDETMGDNGAGGKRKNRGNRKVRPAGWSTHSDKRAIEWNKSEHRLRARESVPNGTGVGWHRSSENAAVPIPDDGARVRTEEIRTTRNKRDVWTLATQPTIDAHFATYPEKLVEPCILAGSEPGDTVLDPFGGTGTTALVALRWGRNATLIELNPDYAAMAERRCSGMTPGLPL